MHINSLKANASVTRTRRQAEILSALSGATSALTDRQIAKILGHSDMNSVRPRITELVGLGVLIERPSVLCTITGRTVRTVGLNHAQPST